MKTVSNAIRVLFVLSCFAITLTAQKDQDLLDILRKETEAYAEADFAAWKSYWVQSANDYFSFSSQNELFHLKGWTEIEKGFQQSFQDREKLPKDYFRRENIKVERQGNMAFITFDQFNRLEANAEEQYSETRIMKKTKAGWKILGVTVVNLSSYNTTGKELHHILLASFKPEAQESDIQYIFDKFNSMVGLVEGMKSCSMLKCSDQASPYPYTFILVFDSQEALNKYSAHENHQAAVERGAKVVDKVKVIDSWQ